MTTTKENPLLAPTRENPLLAKLRMPGRVFTLPSRGMLYDGEVTAQDGEVHVHPMSAIAEIKIKSADMLFNGTAFTEVIKECVPDIIDPMEMYARDVDALMTYLRMVTYGANFEIDVKHSCEHAKEHKITVDLEEVVKQIKFLDPTMVAELYTVNLKETGQVVHLEPTRLRHVIGLLQHISVNDPDSIKAADLERKMIDDLCSVIADVDGVTEKELIREWIRQVPTTAVHAIIEKMNDGNSWGLDFNRKRKCPDCGEEFTYELPLNPVSFFSK